MSKIQLKNWEYDKDCPKTMGAIIVRWNDANNYPLEASLRYNWRRGAIALSIPYSSELELMYEKEKRNLLETNQA